MREVKIATKDEVASIFNGDRGSDGESRFTDIAGIQLRPAARLLQAAFVLLWLAACSAAGAEANESGSLALGGSIDAVQPFCGVVLWSDNPHAAADYKTAIQLEFSYLTFDQVSKAKGVWNWSAVEAALAGAASRGHQMVLRFRYEYPGEAFGLPSWIKREAGYTARSVTVKEGGKVETVELPDWSCPALRDFNTEFFQRFAALYDSDPRLAYLQVGFGFWSEYHLNIDQERALPGQNFPSRSYQADFLSGLASHFTQTPFSISIDAANSWGPFADRPDLLKLGFGTFDDSFLCAEHEVVNEAATASRLSLLRSSGPAWS